MHELEHRYRRQLPKPELYAERRRSRRERCSKASATRSRTLANTASLLYHSLPDLNWVGFYLLKDGELVVGPFQGKPACVRIALGKGVCGTAAARRATVIVAERARVRRPHRLRLGVELGDRRAAGARQRADRRARPRQPEARPLRRGGSGGAGASRRRGAEGAVGQTSGFTPRQPSPSPLPRDRCTRRCAYRRG